MKEKVDIIVKGEYILTMTDAEEPVTNGAVVIKDARIVEIGREDTIINKYEAQRVLGGNRYAVIPGFVNTHTHAAMVYFRGLADDLPLKDWLEGHIWPAEQKYLGDEFVYDATELACLEMIRAGITLFNDMYFFEDASAKAIKKAGIRAVLGTGILDFPTVAASTSSEYFEKAEGFIKRYSGDELIVPAIAPHAPYTCSPETYKRAMELAEKYDVTVHTHLSETQWEVEEISKRYGNTPVKHLDSHGLLNSRVLAAHCVWLTEEEIDILAQRGVSISHCLESNLKLSSGIAPVTEMLQKGVRVTFGTDGAASNNDLDLMSEMSTAAKLHKAVSGDPTVLSAREALLMATKWGAQALGLGDKVGSIEAGKLADLVLINLKSPHLTPLYDIYSHIVYSAKSSDVETVIVNGRVVLNGGDAVNLDMEEIFYKANQWAHKIRKI